MRGQRAAFIIRSYPSIKGIILVPIPTRPGFLSNKARREAGRDKLLARKEVKRERRERVIGETGETSETRGRGKATQAAGSRSSRELENWKIRELVFNSQILNGLPFTVYLITN
jgi:hypothetical protein